jgi:hypothetical protein
MKYHEKKEAAQAAAAELGQDPRIANARVAFEPYNGWVVVLIPRFIDCSDLADCAEVHDGVQRVDPNRQRPKALPKAPSPKGDVGGGKGATSAPSKGATAKVWEIANSLPGADRKAIMAACISAGINPATAGTQYSKWRKANGN